MPAARAHAAVDLGAGSGRVMVGRVAQGRVELHEVHRFVHDVRVVEGHERWDLARILAEVELGLAAAGRAAGAELVSVGVCGWGVDHAFLDAEGRLLGDPISYRDRRTEGILPRLFARVPRAELHARTGIQSMPINTSAQLLAQLEAGEWPAGARRLLMVPDLVHRHLCGSGVGEETNASTTQLCTFAPDGARTWDQELCARLGIPAEVLPPLVKPGTRLGTLRPELARRLGLGELAVVAPGTHDTASAVAGTPLEPGWAYVSSGTWSLVGLETRAPVLTARAAAENVTNEAGVAGTNRLLKNVMGLWLLESCRRAWARRGAILEHDALQQALAGRAPLAQRLDPDDARFLNPPDMPAAIAAQLAETGQAPVEGELDLAQLVLEALARRTAEVVTLLAELTGTRVAGLCLVGGGSQNEFLNRATAMATGLPVRAGPVEATALGNVLVQALHDGAFSDLAAARRAVATSFPPRRYAPGAPRGAG
ncbi:MAG TPA: rhamnulokinase family protein [Planctomycetota bacterium]